MEHSFEKIDVDSLLWATKLAVEVINKQDVKTVTIPTFSFLSSNGVICEVQVTVVTDEEDFINEIHF